MRSSEVAKMVRVGLVKAGVPDHLFSVEQDSPMVNIRVLIGGRLIELKVRSKATKAEVEAKLAELRNRWEEHKGVQGVIE